MSCPHCGADAVSFAVPPALREHAPASTTAICTRCLRTFPADESESTPADVPDLSAVDLAFPDGDAGVALALVCGHLESFALNRASIEFLTERAERAGADPLAFLDRLDAPDAAFDLERRRAALLDIL